jgi:hypothetical protein
MAKKAQLFELILLPGAKMQMGGCMEVGWMVPSMSNRFWMDHLRPSLCCDSALMRYWSPEYFIWRVALLTEVGEEACAVPPIFFLYFYAFY